MKYTIAIMIGMAMAAGAYWLWAAGSQHDQEPVECARPDSPDAERILTVLTSRIESASKCMSFGGEPWDPTTTLEKPYEARAKLIDEFHLFLRETALPDESVEVILMLLGEYQQHARTISQPFRGGTRYKGNIEYLLRQASQDMCRLRFGARMALDELLDHEEMLSWEKHLENVNIWYQLAYWPYPEPMLAPLEAPCDQRTSR
jgi:hypothetical protein